MFLFVICKIEMPYEEIIQTGTDYKLNEHLSALVAFSLKHKQISRKLSDLSWAKRKLLSLRNEQMTVKDLDSPPL